MADPRPTRPDYQATIDRLVVDLQPVQRLRPFRTVLGAWVSVMVVVIVMAACVPRPDLGSRAAQTGYLIDLLGLAAATVLLGALALRSAEPDRIPSPPEQALGWLLATLAVATIALQPVATDVPLGAFLSVGIGCAWATIKFAAVPVALLFVAVRRGAAVEPRAAGAWAAAAGLGLAYLAMRLHCPMDDGLHLFVWHLLPVVLGTVAGAALGRRWLGRWSR